MANNKVGPWTGSPFRAGTVGGRIEGVGSYTFPNGDRYEGNISDGKFDGKGVIHMQNGGRFMAKWIKGEATEGEYVFPDELPFKDKEWEYCTSADRRYWSEQQRGIHTKEPRPSYPQLTNNARTPRIPPGTYDVGDGYLDVPASAVWSYDGKTQVRQADKDEVAWAQERCRRGVRED